MAGHGDAKIKGGTENGGPASAHVQSTKEKGNKSIRGEVQRVEVSPYAWTQAACDFLTNKGARFSRQS